MSQLNFLELWLLNLQEKIAKHRREYLPRREAYRQQLRHHTGQDFGYDVEAWRSWVREHPNSIRAAKDVSSRLTKFVDFASPDKPDTRET
jgi:hypothetical protein